MIFGFVIIMKCNGASSDNYGCEEKSHLALTPPRAGFPRFIEFASPLTAMYVSKDRMIAMDVSENDNGNFSFPLFDSVDPSPEVMLMWWFFWELCFGDCSRSSKFVEKCCTNYRNS